MECPRARGTNDPGSSPKHTPLPAKMTVESDKDKKLPSVGDRVVDNNGYRATVRYVGPVCTAKDPTSKWIGEKQHIVLPIFSTLLFKPCQESLRLLESVEDVLHQMRFKLAYPRIRGPCTALLVTPLSHLKAAQRTQSVYRCGQSK